MGILGSNNGINSQMMQGIQQAKGIMNSMNNPYYFMQQNPQMSQVLDMCKGKNPEQVFRSLAQQRGIDPDAFLKELRK